MPSNDGIGGVDEIVVGEAQAINERGREDVHPVGDQSLQMIVRRLPVGRRAERAIKLALAQVVFKLQRVAEADAIAFA